MVYKRYVKKTAAAALGYIVGNVSGAVTGWNLADKLPNYSDMPRFKRKPQWMGGPGSSKTITKRRRVGHGMGPNKSFIGKRRASTVRITSVKRRKKMVRSSPLISISQHNDLSNHGLPDIMLGPRKSKYKSMGAFHYTFTSEFVQNIGQGYQAVDILNSIFTQQAIVGVSSTNRLQKEKLSDDLFALNPWVVVPTSPLFPSSIYNPIAQDRILVKDVECTVEMLSMENVPQAVDLYVVTPKFDDARDPVNVWVEGLVDTALGQGFDTPANLIGTATATPGGQSINNYGSTPHPVRLFRRLYKVVHVKSVVLQPGDQYNLKFKIIYNKVLQKNIFQIDRNQQYLAGWTVNIMVVAKGGLVGITSAAGIGAGEVGHSTVKVGYAMHYKYNLGALPTTRIETQRIFQGQLVNDITNVQQKVNDIDTTVSLSQS
jgi:hypothetical protein